jgi:predicted GNAT superfamily acetyltransferase
MKIRPLTEIPEFQSCIELQRECFGFADADLLPLRFYVVLKSIGGLVLGAFDGDRLVGFLNTLPGLRHGNPYWHSQMLAVAKDQWNTGVGSNLKLAQRDNARAQGIQRIEWTFDPLESRNAYLNIQKLGAIVRRYHPNHYGPITEGVYAGLESDRVIAEWWVNRPRPTVSDAVRRVFIPADIQELKQQSLTSANDVQLRVREQFLKNLGDDYFAAGFERTEEWSAYLFIPGASSAYQTD